MSEYEVNERFDYIGGSQDDESDLPTHLHPLWPVFIVFEMAVAVIFGILAGAFRYFIGWWLLASIVMMVVLIAISVYFLGKIRLENKFARTLLALFFGWLTFYVAWTGWLWMSYQFDTLGGAISPFQAINPWLLNANFSNAPLVNNSNWLFLIVAGVIDFFGILVTQVLAFLSPRENEESVPYEQP